MSSDANKSSDSRDTLESAPITPISMSSESNLQVPGKLYSDITKLKKCYVNILSELDPNKNINYMIANKLHINLDKTCYMHLSPGNKHNDSTEQVAELLLNNDEIVEVSETKFLGVIIDNQLSWKPHIEAIKRKLNCCNGQLNRIKDFVPAELYKTLYQSLFESHLAYGITVWGGISSNRLTSILTAQK